MIHPNMITSSNADDEDADDERTSDDNAFAKAASAQGVNLTRNEKGIEFDGEVARL